MCCPEEVLCIFMALVRVVTIIKTVIGTCCCCLTSRRRMPTISTNTHILLWNVDLTYGSTSAYTPIQRKSGMAALMPSFSIMWKKINNYYMNLSDEDRRIVVNLELEKAESILAEQEILRQAGFWSTMVNRLYYALFHAVSALLISDGHEVGTHKGAAIRFQQYYVKTQLFTVEEGRFYSQLQSMRESADYNCSYDVSEDDVVSRIEPARQLVEKIRQYIAMK